MTVQFLVTSESPEQGVALAKAFWKSELLDTVIVMSIFALSFIFQHIKDPRLGKPKYHQKTLKAHLWGCIKSFGGLSSSGLEIS